MIQLIISMIIGVFNLISMLIALPVQIIYLVLDIVKGVFQLLSMFLGLIWSFVALVAITILRILQYPFK